MDDGHGHRTTVHVTYPRGVERLRLRGSAAGLDWHADRLPDDVEGARATFALELPHGEAVELKLVRDDGAWMVGRNVVVGCGDATHLHPAFDRARGHLEAPRVLALPGREPLTLRVFLPPSYDEQPTLTYPVLYALDGQSMWSDGTDPFGVWSLDRVVDELWELGALSEIVVVTIDTGARRLDKLGPVPDAQHGGGGGDVFLRALVEDVRDFVASAYRVRTDRGSTAILGSSMGGLFAFHAAWTRPDVFGAAICLSPSFWWADRFAIRAVQGGVCPAPRPRIYLDSGAAASGLEADGSTRDGVHNTRAMYRALVGHCYGVDDDLHLLSWAGHRHDSGSWAARVGVPLQLVFPCES